MPQIDVSGTLLSIAAGGAVGLVFFGGLWLSVKVIHRVKHPGWLMLFSFVVRILVFVAAFYAIAKYGNWLYLVIALVAALIVRTVLMRTIGNKGIESEKSPEEASENKKKLEL